MPINAAVIQELGWRQGSVFTLAASTPIIREHRERIAVHDFIIPDNARLILASHDCDIVHQDLHEPRVEVCPAVRVDGALSGNYTGTRNARRLHLQMQINGEHLGYELRAPTRFYLPREILQNSAPDANVRLHPKHHSHFCHWLAKRVRRTALPTSFDGRVPSKVRSKIRKLLHPLSDSLHSVLIAIDPRNDELGPDQDYAIQIVALMDPDDFADPPRRDAVKAAMQKLEALLDQCEGIDLDACECRSTGDITLEEFQGFSIWDYDDLSFDVEAIVPQQTP
jgi:hypothetical protein